MLSTLSNRKHSRHRLNALRTEERRWRTAHLREAQEIETAASCVRAVAAAEKDTKAPPMTPRTPSNVRPPTSDERPAFRAIIADERQRWPEEEKTDCLGEPNVQIPRFFSKVESYSGRSKADNDGSDEELLRAFLARHAEAFPFEATTGQNNSCEYSGTGDSGIARVQEGRASCGVRIGLGGDGAHKRDLQMVLW